MIGEYNRSDDRVCSDAARHAISVSGSCCGQGMFKLRSGARSGYGRSVKLVRDPAAGDFKCHRSRRTRSTRSLCVAGARSAWVGAPTRCLSQGGDRGATSCAGASGTPIQNRPYRRPPTRAPAWRRNPRGRGRRRRAAAKEKAAVASPSGRGDRARRQSPRSASPGCETARRREIDEAGQSEHRPRWRGRPWGAVECARSFASTDRMKVSPSPGCCASYHPAAS